MEEEPIALNGCGVKLRSLNAGKSSSIPVTFKVLGLGSTLSFAIAYDVATKQLAMIMSNYSNSQVS